MLETKGEKGVGLGSLDFLRGFKIKKKCLFFLVREFYILCSYFFSGLYTGVYTEVEPCV